MKGCSGNENYRIVTETVTVRDTITNNVVIEKPVPVAVEYCLLDTIQITDTLKVLEDYFAEKEYNILYSDSNLSLCQDVIVERNGLKTVSTDYTIFKEKTIVREKYMPAGEKFAVSLAGGLSTDFASVDVEVGALMNIKRHGIGITYGIADHRFSCFYTYKIFAK